MLSEKEKGYIKKLGTLYVQTGSGCCGHQPTFEPVDLIKYLNDCVYNEDLKNYMRFRNMQRYTKVWSCGGGSTWQADCRGNFVKVEGKYVDIEDLKSKLKPSDIQKEIIRFRHNHMKSGRFSYCSSITGNGVNGSYIPDPNGNFVYDTDTKMFIDISEEEEN